MPPEQFDVALRTYNAREAVLTEGDLVTIDAVGVNPNGPDSELLYRLQAPTVPEIGVGKWGESASFLFSVPLMQNVGVILTVADHPIEGSELIMMENLIFSIKVRPLRR